MTVLDQIIAQTRESLQRYVLGFIFQKGGDLMPIQPRVFNDRLDRSGPFLAVGRMAQQFG
jgi:hypothetical protein